MENLGVYEDIKTRTDGDIYVGVVGPVRTGKSTFIKNFMDLLVIPNIENSYKRERARDELPQSAAGRTIMTTEPKFVPNEAVEITVGENLNLRTRLVDCVGYLVNNAIGYMEEDVPRMVKTPWSDEEIPFEEAAEIGTRKVITEHSTIGILVTTDGSITEIPREDYIEAESRVVSELKALNKPFVIVLNTNNPSGEDTIALAKDMEEKYGVSVIPTDCTRLNADDINNIFGKILYEFPVERININLPGWIDGLDPEHELKQELFKEIKEAFKDIRTIKTINAGVSKIKQTEIIVKTTIEKIDLGTGAVTIEISLKNTLFYKILTQITGIEMKNEADTTSSKHKNEDFFKELDKDRKEKGIDQDCVTQIMKSNYHVCIAEDRIGTMGYYTKKEDAPNTKLDIFNTTIDLKDMSLPVIAVIIGLVDGFNPCAMWVLIFLISMLLGMKDKKKMKVCLVGSSGGHLTHLYMLKPFWKDKEHFWVTFDKEDARSLLEGEKMYPCYYPTNRSLKALIKNTKIAWNVLHKEKPDLIISCGAAVAVPFFYIGKMMGAKLVYIEVFDRIDKPTMTGKMVYPIVDKFVVQWEEQKKVYPKAVNLGSIF